MKRIVFYLLLKREININLAEEFDINNQKYQVIEYKILEKDEYQYSECNSICNTYTKVIIPKLNEYVMVVKINNLNDLEVFKNYVGFIYTIDNKKYELSSKSIEVLGRNENNLYLSIPKRINEANSILLTIKTRNTIYNIKLR